MTHDIDPDSGLARLCDEALIAGLTAGLKNATDAALSHGAAKPEVLRRVRAMIVRRGENPRGPVGLAVEAYLSRQ